LPKRLAAEKIYVFYQHVCGQQPQPKQRTPPIMNTPANNRPSDTKVPKQLLEGKRACILDDEKDPVTILEANLKKLGVETQSFNQAGPALEYLRNDPPDILLLDIMMPGMDGWVFYTTLRSEPELRTLPVLFVTCLSEHDLESEMEEDGLCATLSKPVFRDQLIDKMVQLLAPSSAVY
jgi:CheY-like chemotaxis protein